MINRSGIYKITNIATGDCYVGSASLIKHRWRVHTKQAGDNKHHSRIFQRAWNKYGKENFKFSVLLVCEKEFLLTYEQFFINKLIPKYNICKIAGSSLGVKHTDEAKANMANSVKIYSEEGIAAKRKNCRERFTGKSLSQETKEKIAAAHTGKRLSDEHKKKISESSKGRKFSDEHLKNLAATRGHEPRNTKKGCQPEYAIQALIERNKSRTGEKRTPEQRQKLVDAKRAKKLSAT